jgi:uncharacterized protein YbjT (DUF2867 family)
MKVLVIGATGHVGGKTLDALLADGHEVTAFGRSIDKIEQGAPKLSIVKGSVLEEADVDAAIPGHDAVILTFGAPLTRDTILHQPSLCEDGTAKVVAAMKRHGTLRLIAMTAIGAGDSEGHGRFVFRSLIEPVLLGRIMKDRTAQEEVVRASGVPEWVIVRPTELVDGDPAPVRVITDVACDPEPTTITRASVGRTLATLAADKSHDGTTILITN